jgi:hypothetical protein
VTSKTDVEKTLAALQLLIRRPPAEGGERAAMTRQLPLEVTGGEAQYLGLLRNEVKAMETVKKALLADLSFEYLRKPDDDVWQFVGECWADKATDHIPGFIEQHRREPVDRMCFIPVEHLSVATATDVFGIRLLPTDDDEVPQVEPRMSLEKPIGCVAAVVVRGTNLGLMAERARFLALHALRVMRIALREDMGIHDWQLRFRLGMSYAFDDTSSGWNTREDAAYDLGFGGDLIALAMNQPVSRMPAHPTTDIDSKADLALRWMERAWLVGDPLVALLYLFFALEALLGDKSEGLKAHGLAFRQAMLSHIVDENFPNPNETWFLYERVRSGAVHGEDAPDVDRKVVQRFAWDVRRTINQYLTLAEEQHFARRGRLLTFLDEHEDRPKLIAWLRENGGDVWTKFLNDLEGVASPPQ